MRDGRTGLVCYFYCCRPGSYRAFHSTKEGKVSSEHRGPVDMYMFRHLCLSAGLLGLKILEWCTYQDYVIAAARL